MLWIVIEDSKLFTDIDSLSKILNRQGYSIDLKHDDILKIPTTTEINDALKESSEKIILDCITPEEKLGSFYPIFTTIYAKDENFPYKDIHSRYNIKKSDILSERLALTISTPNVTLDDYAGAENLHEDITKMLTLEEIGMRKISGLFLFGVAGSGKSYFAECFAGTTGRLFAELDLAHFMTLPNPTKSIDNLFHFLLDQNDRYLLLIDEIEKMFQFDSSSNNLVSQQVFGKMLTWLAKLYEMNKSNLTFVATANRVELLLINKPEFVRKGRFNRLYFLHYPNKHKSTPKIFDLYIAKEKKHIENILLEQYKQYQLCNISISPKLQSFFTSIEKNDSSVQHIIKLSVELISDFDTDKITKIIDGEFQDEKITKGTYFIYTPPEIKSLVSDLFDFYMEYIFSKIYNDPDTISIIENSKFQLPDIKNVLVDHILYSNPPLQSTAKEGIRTQIAQGSNIKQGDKIAPFYEIN